MLQSQLRSRDEEIDRLKERINETNKRLILLLADKDKLSESLNQAKADMHQVRAQLHQELSVIQNFMANKSSDSDMLLLQKELRDKFDQFREFSDQKIDESISKNDHQILINNRIIVISLAVVSVPICFLLILILYLTLRRDKKIVKSEQRLALNEMNHLRRYNDY
jgi:chromosome segregation ATPase